MAKRITKALWSTAYHEAGHAVMVRYEGFSLRRVTIIPAAEYAGRVKLQNPLRGIHLNYDGSDRARLKAERAIRICLAGPLAQRRFNLKGWRAYHGRKDFETAFDIIQHLVGSDEEAVAYLKLLDIQSKKILELDHVWGAVEVLASALIEHRKLSGKDATAVIEQAFC